MLRDWDRLFTAEVLTLCGLVTCYVRCRERLGGLLRYYHREAA